MKVSVIIPTYNRKRVLKRCLELLFAQDYPKDKYEVVLVDDGSTDGTKKMVEYLQPPCHFKYLSQKRSGPHIARNKGIRNARGEIVIFVDSDILTPPQLIKEHMEFHKKYGEKLIVSGPAVRTSNLMDDFSDKEKRIKKKRWDLSGPSLITSNLSVRKEYLERINGFDENFQGLGWHDWDLGLRLKKLGLLAKRNLHAIVYHYKKERETQDLGALTERRVQRGRNAVLYYKKHPTFKIKLGIRAHHLLKDRLLWWLDTSFGKNLISWAEENNEKFLLKCLIQWKLDKAYAKGLREGMKKYQVRLWPWM